MEDHGMDLHLQSQCKLCKICNGQNKYAIKHKRFSTLHKLEKYAESMRFESHFSRSLGEFYPACRELNLKILKYGILCNAKCLLI